MSLGPVLDVATNPRNPVIGDRAYGRSAALVARLGAAYIQGLQGGGVIGSAKHFPGHGDTSVDSHLGLPVIKSGRTRLDAVELVPFRRAMEPDVGVASIMTGHLALPRIDPARLPASLSRPIVTGLLRDELGWDGLVLTDDMGAMDAITDRYGPGEAAVLAVAAGVDLLIIVRDGDNQSRRAMRWSPRSRTAGSIARRWRPPCAGCSRSRPASGCWTGCDRRRSRACRPSRRRETPGYFRTRNASSSTVPARDVTRIVCGPGVSRSTRRRSDGPCRTSWRGSRSPRSRHRCAPGSDPCLAPWAPRWPRRGQ